MVEFTSYSHPGNREINEDSWGVATHQDSYCFVVADGLGGHGGGDVASKCAVDAVCDRFAKTGYTNDFFQNAFDDAQRKIIDAQMQAKTVSQMKTTMVVLVVTPQNTYWAHIGDSRLYHWRQRKLKEQTLDHSVPQMLAMSGEIKESEIRHHPDRNRLLRVLGIKGEMPRFETGHPISNYGEHTFLLCTDGYWELIEEQGMTDLLRGSTAIEEWLLGMNAEIRRNGLDADMDNYTAIAVRVKKKHWWEK